MTVAPGKIVAILQASLFSEVLGDSVAFATWKAEDVQGWCDVVDYFAFCTSPEGTPVQKAF
jgi:hypothetical protein